METHASIIVLNNISFEVNYDNLINILAREAPAGSKATDLIPREVVHYAAPRVGEAAASSECVAMCMEQFGVETLPVCLGSLAVMEGIEEDLGLDLIHVSDICSTRFKNFCDEMARCLNSLGWDYNGWLDAGIGEEGLVSFH